MKVIATFDKSITEVLADKVKARMNFKVVASDCLLFCVVRQSWADRKVFLQKGSSGYLPLLRRSLDVSHQRCEFQAGQSEYGHGGEDQDRELQFEETWGAIGWLGCRSRFSHTLKGSLLPF